MMVMRLLPVILTTLLLAAHVLRFYGILPAAIVLLLLVTLFVRKNFMRRMWQAFLALATIMWIHTTILLVDIRLAHQAPWIRLAAILVAVIAFNIFTILWLENETIKRHYQT